MKLAAGREVIRSVWEWAVEPVSTVAPGDSFESLWISVWWGFSHFLHLFELGQVQVIDTQLIVVVLFRGMDWQANSGSLADNTGIGNSSSECGRLWLEVLPWSITLIWLRLLFWEQTFGRLSPQVDKFKELVMSRDTLWIFSAIQRVLWGPASVVEMKWWTIRFVAKCFQGTYVLLSCLMELAKLLATAVLEEGDVHNLFGMNMLGLVLLWAFRHLMALA